MEQHIEVYFSMYSKYTYLSFVELGNTDEIESIGRSSTLFIGSCCKVTGVVAAISDIISVRFAVFGVVAVGVDAVGVGPGRRF